MTPRDARAAAADATGAGVHVVTRGDIEPADRAYAVRKIADVASGAATPLATVDVRLSVAADPARARPAAVECSLDCDGQILRAHAAADTTREAADLVVDRLQRLLHRMEERARAVRLRHRDAGPGTWHHGDARTRRAPVYDRPVEEREIVARKTVSPASETVDEAVGTLELLDHDFLLYLDASTGEHAVLHRTGDGRYELHQPRPRPDAIDGCVAPVALSAVTASTQTVAGAVERLDVGGEPFVFFVDAETGAARVLYRRYDGHYGLITATS